MDSAAMLERAGEELARVIDNRDRLMRNRNNKQRELQNLRAKQAKVWTFAQGLQDDLRYDGGDLARELEKILTED